MSAYTLVSKAKLIIDQVDYDKGLPQVQQMILLEFKRVVNPDECTKPYA